MNENIVSVENVIKQIDGMNLNQQLELIAYIANKIQQYKSAPNKKTSLKVSSVAKDVLLTQKK